VVTVSAEATVAAVKNAAPRTSVNPAPLQAPSFPARRWRAATPFQIADQSDVRTVDLLSFGTESRPRAAPLEFDVPPG
jgi:hypothetical protein